VVLENGRPAQVSWPSAGDGAPSSPAGGPRRGASATAGVRASGGRVARVIDEWRVAGRWWANEVRRDCYLVELDGGRLVELYREGESWCVTGVAD
jgi:hypothetical protein